MAEERLPVEGTLPDRAVAQPIEKRSFISLMKEWPLNRKIAFGAVILVSLSLFGVLIFQGRTADYQLLYANLSENDAAPVVTWLKGEKIPYQLKNSGRNICSISWCISFPPPPWARSTCG